MKEISVADQFLTVLRQSGLSNKEFAARLGLTASQITNIIKGRRNPSMAVLEKLKDNFGLDFNWYFYGNAGPASIDQESDSAFIPYFEQGAAAGRGIEIDDAAPRRRLTVPGFLLKGHDPRRVAAVAISGDSMIGEKINDGDVVLFHIGLKNGNGIYIVSVETTLLCKRIDFDEISRKITLISANPAYAPRELSGPELENVKIEGCVIAVLHRE
jgi:SOS-response transcriptional repressor LexA